MNYLIEFKSNRFNPSTEPENPINPIRGMSLLKWLKAYLEPKGIELTEPDAEDWGWYSYCEWQGQTYLVGAIAFERKREDDPVDWMLQVDKERTALAPLQIIRQKSVLYFQFVFVFFDEFADIIRHVENFDPLLHVQRDGKASQPIHRDSSLLAHLERQTFLSLCFESFVLRLQALQFCLHLIVAHIHQ